MKQRTLVIIKPDAYESKHFGEIISIIERNRLEIVEGKVIKLSREEAEKFYEEHRGKPFYEGLVEFMSSGRAFAMVVEGENAVESVRKIIGATDPKKAEVGTVRYIYGSEMPKNAIHASDSPKSARREITFFFGEDKADVED